MVSDAAKAVLTVMLFTNHRLSSGFVIFNSNSSDPSDSTIGRSYFARYTSNYSEPGSYSEGYPTASTDEYASTNDSPNENTAIQDDSNKDDRSVSVGVKEEADIDMPVMNDQRACLRGGKSSAGQFCQRRFDWIDTDSNVSGTNRTSIRRKRSTPFLKHGCCISSTEFVTYSSYQDYKGTIRSLALVDGKAQYFAKDTCGKASLPDKLGPLRLRIACGSVGQLMATLPFSPGCITLTNLPVWVLFYVKLYAKIHNETCARCQHCQCRLDHIYEHALFTEGKDEQGRDILKLGMFRFPHICRCINM